MRSIEATIPSALISCALLAALGLVGCGSNTATVYSDSSVQASTLDVAAETAAPADQSSSGPCVSMPATCVAPAPSYAQDIAPILDLKCNTCHAAPDAGLWPLVDYDDVSDWKTLILADVEYCTMPPTGAPQLSPDEERTILAWIVCGVPQ